MKKIFIITTIILITIILILCFAFDNRLHVVHYNLHTDKVFSPVKLALITDLHNCLYGENQSELINAIDDFQPDAILLGGDIFDDSYVNDNGKILVDAIAKQYPVYYVSGNHEWWSGEMYQYFSYLETAGVTILRGTGEYLTINGNTLRICGTDDPEVNRYDTLYLSFQEQLQKIAEDINPEYYQVLLTHRPEKAQQYFQYDFDLVLSGHAHGGQARIPMLLNGFYAPNQGFFPEYAGGTYDFNNRKLIVSRGLSRENTKLPRIFNRPELVLVTIINK